MDGLITDECPVLWLDEYATVVRAALHLKQGLLPHSGGWAEQPAILMQLAEIFNNEVRRG